ncbi:hypothetical protein [Dyella sp.]|uniref:hypothetical protein n=1 Tax=Dyella sp. TaxID=1869338 RepID=UPI002ED57092
MEGQKSLRVDALLLGFTQLPKPDQERFLDRLNDYMFGSPGRRKQMIDLWCGSLATSGSHARDVHA